MTEESADSTNNALAVDISDALSEKDKVKFTIHTKTTLPLFREPEFSVVREHEEFVWLHDCYEDNEEFAGHIIPAAPPKPNFETSRDKLQKLGEGENSMTKEEFAQMKQELEAEYLATFKKTVALHELFLCRLASHPILCNFHNFRVFLEYDQDLNVRGKNKKEKLDQLIRNVSMTMDETMLANYKEVDDYFEQQKSFFVEYTQKIKDATFKGDKVVKSNKNVSEDYSKIGQAFIALAAVETSQLETFLQKFAQGFLGLKKLENRITADADLKLCDVLHYFYRDSTEAKNLLFRRLRSLSDFESSNRALEKSRIKGKDVVQAENDQISAKEKFQKLSELAKIELKDFKERRITGFRKNLIELAELQIKHSKVKNIAYCHHQGPVL
ncbi:unnamed protein product [Gordionus sp. m RMFG-2023]